MELLGLQESGGGAFIETQYLELDSALGGGLPMGMLTELVGPPGVGKSQFCMMATVMALLPSEFGGIKEGSGVVYVDTERKFSSTR